MSDEVSIFILVLNTLLYGNTQVYNATVTLQPNWSLIYSGETITVRCEIQGGGDTEWEYEWNTTSSNKPPTHNEYRINGATVSDSGDYKCRGRKDYSLTQWSDVIRLTVSSDKPQASLRADRTVIPAGGNVTLTCSVRPMTCVSQEGLYSCRGGRGDRVYYTEYSQSVSIDITDKPRPVLTVSPSWLSPGASVTLNCEVKHPSAGWRFYWYKTVPDLSHNYYSYELLPGNSRGTEQDSYIVHGQTHTAGYVCRTGKGDPVYYTENSEPKFVWSGDFHPAASLTVNPDRVQHFTSDSVSLSCEGNSAEWRVRGFNEHDSLSHCSDWRRMTGSTCNVGLYWSDDAVYWCESGSGEFSNAVNITVQNDFSGSLSLKERIRALQQTKQSNMMIINNKYIPFFSMVMFVSMKQSEALETLKKGNVINQRK
ncbi:obscurin-like protein, partial [Lates japonicus]